LPIPLPNRSLQAAGNMGNAPLPVKSLPVEKKREGAREARNQPIAARKVWRPRFPSEWHFSQSQPGGQDVIKEIGMFGGINAILAAGENCDGSGCKAGAMRRGIDAAR